MPEPIIASTVRIYQETDKKKFEELQGYLDEHSSNYSNQETFLFAMRLGYQRLRQLKSNRESVESNLP